MTTSPPSARRTLPSSPELGLDRVAWISITPSCTRRGPPGRRHNTLTAHRPARRSLLSRDCHLIAAKLHRALSGRDAAEHDGFTEDDPIQNDWNGSAKVALISLDRSIVAWNKIATTTADADAAAIAERLQALRMDVQRAFPNARRFVRPGFDE
jgi:hypothetical protein